MSRVIEFKNVSNPNFTDSNAMHAQAMQGYKNMMDALSKTATDYQTVVRNRNHGLLQDYVNQAKSQEELQSEAFQQGYQNLLNSVGNDIDAVEMNKYRDARGDILSKRANDVLNLDRNKLGLESDTWVFNQKQTDQNNLDATRQYLSLASDPIKQAAFAQKAQEQGLVINPESVQKFNADSAALQAAARANRIGDATEQTQIDTAVQNLQNARTDNQARQAQIKASEASTAGQLLQNRAAQYQNDFTGFQMSELKESNPQLNNPSYTKDIGGLLSGEFKTRIAPYQNLIETQSAKVGIPPDYAYFILNAESGGNVDATSPTGVKGIMQVTQRTFNAFGRKGGDRTNPEHSIEAGINYLGELFKKFPNDPLKALVAYNQGGGADTKNGKGVGLAVQKATAAGEPNNWVKYLDKEGQGYANKMRNFLTYNATGKDGRTLTVPDGMKMDTFTGSSSGSGAGSKTPKFSDTAQGQLVATANRVSEFEAKQQMNKASAMADVTQNPETWLKEAKGYGGNNRTLYDLAKGNYANGKQGEIIKGFDKLTPAQQVAALDLAKQSYVNSGGSENEWWVTDSNLASLKKHLQNATNTISKGDADALSSFRNSQVDNLVRNLTAQGYSVDDVMNALNMDDAGKQAYYSHLKGKIASTSKP